MSKFETHRGYRNEIKSQKLQQKLLNNGNELAVTADEQLLYSGGFTRAAAPQKRRGHARQGEQRSARCIIAEWAAGPHLVSSTPVAPVIVRNVVDWDGLQATYHLVNLGSNC